MLVLGQMQVLVLGLIQMLLAVMAAAVAYEPKRTHSRRVGSAARCGPGLYLQSQPDGQFDGAI